MTYNVFGWTLSLPQSVNQPITACHLFSLNLLILYTSRVQMFIL